MDDYDAIHQKKSGLNDADWEAFKSMLYPRCKCGKLFHYVTDGHYNFTGENYELYACHSCGNWQTIITKNAKLLSDQENSDD